MKCNDMIHYSHSTAGRLVQFGLNILGLITLNPADTMLKIPKIIITIKMKT